MMCEWIHNSYSLSIPIAVALVIYVSLIQIKKLKRETSKLVSAGVSMLIDADNGLSIWLAWE